VVMVPVRVALLRLMFQVVVFISSTT